MIISKTPFRISFFGGGTDYPAWFNKYEGAVLSTTIDKYCYINIRYLPPFFEHKHRIVHSLVENVKNSSQIKHPAVRAILEYFKINKGVEIHHDGDLPARSGIGSSSSFTVGMVNSFYALKGKIISKRQLSKEAIYIERQILKECVGSQDQIAVAHGGFNKIIFRNDDDFRVEAVSLRKEKIEELESHLMLVFTGFSRFASDIAAEQIKNTPARRKELNTMLEMVDQALEILNRDKGIEEFGRLLHESWQIKKSLSKRVTNSGVDNLYGLALKNGAIGGKLLGAGGGGFMILFVKPEDRKNVAKKLKNFLEVKFRFENEGSQIIYYNPQEV